MTSVDILSDDDDDETSPPPPVEAPVAPPANLPPGGIDILPDDEEEAPSAQPLLSTPAPQPEAAVQAEEAAPQAKEQRSAVVAKMDLADDSEDEGIAVVAAAAGAASATAATPANGGAGDSEDEEDEDLSTLVAAAPTAPPAVTEPATVESTPARKRELPSDAAAVPSPPGPPAKKAATKAEPKAKAGATKEKKGDAAEKGKTDAKDRKLSKSEMESRVLEYMQQQNRPYNVQNVFDNLHGVVPKSQVLQILDSLSASGLLTFKEYGKFKYYLAAQGKSSDGASKKEEEQALQTAVSQAEANVKSLRAKVEAQRQAGAELRGRKAAVTEAAEAAEKAKSLEQRCAELKNAAPDEGDCPKLDEAQVQAIEKEFREAHAAWRRRKRLCMDLLRSLSEASGAPLAKLVDTYGVDTDEACGQTLPPES